MRLPTGHAARRRAVAARRAARRDAGRALDAAVFAGGAVGAVLRLGLLDVAPVRAGAWPWATFVANMAGSLLLGVVAAALIERPRPSGVRAPFLAVGLCGALTTFSALQVEAIELVRRGSAGMAAAYLATSLVAGIMLVGAGTAAGRRMRR